MPPPIIGLAKKHETVFFVDARAPLNLPLNHPGLQLLQRVRDEAHRFANTYNAVLRSKKIRESVLEDFAGLGPVRRGALLAHFGSIDRLRTASIAEIAEVEGFGPKLAAELHAFLARKEEPSSSIVLSLDANSSDPVIQPDILDDARTGVGGIEVGADLQGPRDPSAG
jgi:excinuclease ABC subunit C